MPPVDGSAGTVMKTDGNGNLYWGSDIFGGGGGIGGGHADSLVHLNRIVPGDSFATYIDLYSINNTTSNVFTVGSGAGAGANKIALGSTTNTILATATIKPAAITSNITLTLPAVTGNLALITNISDSNFVLTSETSAWDKNSSDDITTTILNDSNYVLTSETSAWDKTASNDLVTTDTTDVTGKVSTQWDLSNYSNTSYHVGDPAYGSIKDFITDGNKNWNNSYGYIASGDANTVTEPMFYAVNSPTDEYVLTYEATGGIGNFEWQASGVVGDTSNYTLSAMDSLLALAGTAIQSANMNSLAEFDTQVGITGTPSATTYWRGDNSWSTPVGGGLDSVGADASPTLGGNLEINDKNLINTTPTFSITPTELSYIDAGTSNFQTQINAFQDSLQSLRSMLSSILASVAGCCDLSDITPPAAPTSLVATADNDTAKVRLTWTKPSDGDLDSTRIYRAVIADTSAYTYLDRVAGTIETYTDTGLSTNTAYWYKLKAVDDSSNVSGYSNRDSALTFTTGGPTPLYTLDFEEGSLRPDWTTCGDSSDFSVATGGKYSGTYGMRVTAGGDAASKTITGLDSCWVTLQMRIPDAAFNSAAQAYFSYFNSEPSIWGFQTITDSSTKAVYWVAGPNWAGHVVAATPIISRGVWHKIKMFMKKGATSSHGLWVDGTAFNGTGYVNGKIAGTANEQITSFVITLGGTTITGAYIDIDDIKIYDADPGTN
jgi:hypothetical protein